MNKFLLLFYIICLPFYLSAQSVFSVGEPLEWSEQAEIVQTGNLKLKVWTFKGGIIGDQYPDVPIFLRSLAIPGPGSLDA